MTYDTAKEIIRSNDSSDFWKRQNIQKAQQVINRHKQYSREQYERNRNKLAPVNLNVLPFNSKKVEAIAEIVCKSYNLPAVHIRVKCRSAYYRFPRQIVHYVTRMCYNKMSLKLLAKETGLSDHSTVIHSIETIDNMMSQNSEFKKEVENYISEIKKLEL